MSCEPSYTYRPTFSSGSTPCAAPAYTTTRSRVTVTPPPQTVGPQPLFFRSKHQNAEANNIAVEMINGPGSTIQLNVVYNGAIVKSYGGLIEGTVGQITILRNMIEVSDPNNYIEMPPVGFDILDLRGVETDGDNITEAGISTFPRTPLTGGQGAPTDANVIPTIRTGPERTLFIVSTEEDITGAPTSPPASRRVQQWNGHAWISYCNNVAGSCPGEGTC
jgi:hypothetical protein